MVLSVVFLNLIGVSETPYLLTMCKKRHTIIVSLESL